MSDDHGPASMPYMDTTFEARHISVTIDRPWDEVYEFTHLPANFARWAAGLAEFVDQVGDELVTTSAGGTTTVRFSPRNEFGVMDHWVVPSTGIEVYVPLRVIRNGEGAEVTLTLFRTPEMSDRVMERDAEWVARDLTSLKGLLEG